MVRRLEQDPAMMAVEGREVPSTRLPEELTPAPPPQERSQEPLSQKVAALAVFLIALTCGTATNYLIKLAALDEPPIALNGWRTLLAAFLLAGLTFLFIPFRSLRLSRSEVQWYVVLAALTMAVPHALIFVGTREMGVTLSTLAFIEAVVIVIVLLYLFTDGKHVGVGTVICVLFALAGLVVFLRINIAAPQLSGGDALILVAALALGLGLIVAERLKPPAEGKSFAGKLRQSLKKTFFTCLLSGGGTLLAVVGWNFSRGAADILPIPAAHSWPWILSLAVVGNCLTWFSVFLLIYMDRLVLAATTVAAVPAVTVAVNYVWFQPDVATALEWLGGITVLVSLSALIWLQLIRPAKEAN